MKNNIIFAGCSFTWGQGLWSYMETDKYVPSYEDYIFNNVELPSGSIEFMEKNRFAGIVSSHLNSNQIVKLFNGGTDDESVNFINYLFDRNGNNNTVFPPEKYHFEDIRNIIFQTTQISRSTFTFKYDNQKYVLASEPSRENFGELQITHYYPDGGEWTEKIYDYNPLYDWMYDNDYEVEDVIAMMSSDITDKIENVLTSMEKNGIPTNIFCWSDEYLAEISKRPFLKDRLIKLKYKDKEYECLQHMFTEYPYLEIQYDSEVLHNPGIDGHPSLLCHKIIAKSIIDVIDRKII